MYLKPMDVYSPKTAEEPKRASMKKRYKLKQKPPKPTRERYSKPNCLKGGY